MGHKVLFDGNGSGIIQVVGIGLFVPAEKHNEVMQKWEQVQVERDALAKEVDAANDRNAELIEERNALVAERASVVALAKELAHSAFWAASDSNRADRDSEGFDNDVREQFEKHWSDEDKDKLLPEMCLAYIKAEAVKKFVEFNKGRYTNAFEADISDALETYLAKVRKGGE